MESSELPSWLIMLILILVANGAPIVSYYLFKHRLDIPLDGNSLWRDGAPLLGKSKTYRGLISALVLTSLFAYIITQDYVLGFIVAGLCMLGDLLTSFVKRRLGKPAHKEVMGLDQSLEAALPLLVINPIIALEVLKFNLPPLTLVEIAVTFLLFFAIHVSFYLVIKITRSIK